MSIRQNLKVMRKHKLSSFLAIGGVASAVLMQTNCINYDLIVPKLMVGIGALGAAKFFYEKQNYYAPSRPSFSKGAFLALGGLAATVAYQYNNLPLQGAGQFFLDLFAGYGLVMTGKALFENAKLPKPKIPDFIKINPKEKIKSSIAQMREQSQEPDLEFKPLDLTRR